MSDILQHVLQMSITGSFVIGLVCLARLLLRKAPKVYSYMLWALVLFRLLCPVTVTSSFSLVPQRIATPRVQVSETVEMPKEQDIWENQSVAPIFKPQDTELAERIMPEGERITQGQASTLSAWDVAGVLWTLGVFVMLGYSIFSMVRICRRVQVSVLYEGNVYLAQDIATPFTLGFFAPRIYLPTGLSEKEMGYIVAHEKHHIGRVDHIIKIVAFLTLSIH